MEISLHVLVFCVSVVRSALTLGITGEPEIGISDQISLQEIVGLRPQRAACNLRCSGGRLNRVQCKCICWGNWVGPTCNVRQCRSFQFACDGSRRCINSMKVCNGVRECQDGTDEEGCDCIKVCDNGGTLDAVTCECKCTSMWTGNVCQTRLISNCGIVQRDLYRIIGGAVASIEDHPWQVQLRYRFWRMSWFDFACGGTLVTPSHVVTAAHCVMGKSRHLWRLYFGRTIRERGGKQVRTVKKIYIHAQYNSPTDSNNDIAVMVLAYPVALSRWVHPVCLQQEEEGQVTEFDSHSECYISGWGSLASGKLPYYLQAAQVVLIPQSVCDGIYTRYTDNMICASESLQLLGHVDTCQGDSGGPLVCSSVGELGIARWYLVGITSFGSGCGEPHYPGVYTRTSKYATWLNENMN